MPSLPHPAPCSTSYGYICTDCAPSDLLAYVSLSVPRSIRLPCHRAQGKHKGLEDGSKTCLAAFLPVSFEAASYAKASRPFSFKA